MILLPNEILKCILEYFSAEELTKFRLVCHQWRDVISQVPVSVDLRKLKSGYQWKLNSLFAINCIEMSFSTEKRTQILEIAQNCKNLSKILNCNCSDISEVLSHIQNPLLLKCVSAYSMDDFPFDNLVDVTFLK
jgi:hypothetical protein